MKRPSLLSQIVALNLLMVTAAILVVIFAAGFDFSNSSQRWQFAVLAMAILLTFLLNTLLLRRRFEPLERVLAMMERVDLSRPGRRLELDPDMAGLSMDIERLAATFNRMLDRLENERRRSGELVLRAQEEERRRIARDLHDEVNQSLTALLLRIAAATEDAPPELRGRLEETKQLADRAMGELLDLARQLRPTALDDHGLVAALTTHVRDLDRRGPARASFWADPRMTDLSADAQVVVYRVAQEALVNAVRHSGATRIEVNLEPRDAKVRLEVTDNGSGFAFAEEGKGLGLDGMRERALLVGGTLDIDSRPGKGTSVVLEVPAEPLPEDGTPSDQPGRLETAGAEAEMKILIADDHGIVRSGVKLLLDRQPDMEVVAEAEDGIDALEQAVRLKPDVVVLDVSMPRMTGLQATHEIKQQSPDTQVLILSMHDDERYLFEALRAGASGYVLKRAADKDLVDAVRAASRGEPFLTSTAQQALIRDFIDRGEEPTDELSPREQEVVKLIAEAHTNKEIAEILHLSEKTVESHRGRVLQKLGMRDRVELVRYAIRRGLVEP